MSCFNWLSRVLFAFVVLSLFPVAARAHFPWFATDEEGRALYFFGEHIAERDYKLPMSLTTAEVIHVDDHGKKQPVEMEAIDTETLIGRRSRSKVADSGVLNSVAVDGIYHGSKLTYHAQHLLASDPSQWPSEPAASTDLQAILKPDNDGVAVQVFWQGKPLPGADVQLYCDDGHEEGSSVTSDQGEVRFTAREVEDGLNGILVSHVDKTQSGDHNGEAYTGTAHYLTVTFVSKD